MAFPGSIAGRAVLLSASCEYAAGRNPGGSGTVQGSELEFVACWGDTWECCGSVEGAPGSEMCVQARTKIQYATHQIGNATLSPKPIAANRFAAVRNGVRRQMK